MKLNYLKRTVAILLCSATLLISGCDKDDEVIFIPPVQPVTVGPNLVYYALTASNITIMNANGTSGNGQFVITGLQTGEQMLAIDFRPATGELYGVSNSSKIYHINIATGAANAISATPFFPAIAGTVVGFDFNPTVDRIRLITSQGQNYRINPTTGVAIYDAIINPGPPIVAGAAYTNSFAGAATTTLYAIDNRTSQLIKFDAPNNGTATTVGNLNVAFESVSDFDISPDNSVAIGIFARNFRYSLYSFNLTTGAATQLGDVGSNVLSVAIPPVPSGYAVAGSNFYTFNLATPTAIIAKTITLPAGETIVGMDFRPVTGQLYSLGQSGKIYTVDPATGIHTALAAPALALNGTSFGFDFNPTVDRIRVISNTGQNLRLLPDGNIAATDGSVNPAGSNISGAAYTNNFPGATSTLLYGIDFTNDRLTLINPPNNGTLVNIGPLGINVDAGNGFDIGGTSGVPYAVLSVSGVSKLYRINLGTGAATVIGDMPAGITAFTAGIGF